MFRGNFVLAFFLVAKCTLVWRIKSRLDIREHTYSDRNAISSKCNSLGHCFPVIWLQSNLPSPNPGPERSMTRILALSLCVLAFASSLNSCLGGRPGSLQPLRPNPIHPFYLECRWLRGAATHAAGLAGLQPCLVSEGDWIVFTSERARIGRSLSAFIPTERASSA